VADSHKQPARAHFADSQSALDLAAARLRYIAGTAWSAKSSRIDFVSQPMNSVLELGFGQTVIGMIAFLEGVVGAKFALVRPGSQQSSVRLEMLSAIDRLELVSLYAGLCSPVSPARMRGLRPC
jgi:hypothetical protein